MLQYMYIVTHIDKLYKCKTENKDMVRRNQLTLSCCLRYPIKEMIRLGDENGKSTYKHP